jgi:hypothetical protein
MVGQTFKSRIIIDKDDFEKHMLQSILSLYYTMTNLLCLIKEFTLKVSLLMTIKIERVYNNPKGNNGSFRILVDRLWPRGLSKK